MLFTFLFAVCLGWDCLIIRLSIWTSPICACNNLSIFSFSEHFSILILKVSTLINTQEIKMLLHTRIGPSKLTVSWWDRLVQIFVFYLSSLHKLHHHIWIIAQRQYDHIWTILNFFTLIFDFLISFSLFYLFLFSSKNSLVWN